jgi:hypothetical protein
MLPGDERTPVVDWTDPDQKRRIFVEGYLVESQSLSGLSGSPVFVRPEVSLDFSDTLIPEEGNRLPDVNPVITGGLNDVRLLGIWQGAWDAKPDEILSARTGDEVRVPVGMGVVVPAHPTFASAREHRRLMQKSVVVDLLDEEIRHVGARDESACPAAWINQRAIRARLRPVGQNHGTHDHPVELTSADDAFPARPCRHRRAPAADETPRYKGTRRGRGCCPPRSRSRRSTA